MRDRKLFYFIFILCFSIVLGPAYNTYKHYDFSHSIDTYTYLELAKGNFNVSPVRRYRPIVPFLSGALSYIIELGGHFKETGAKAVYGTLPLSFFFINSLIIGLSGAVLFLISRSFGLSIPFAFISTLPFLTSRWTDYSAGLPMTDSLFFLTIFTLLLSIKVKNLNLALLSSLIGIFAKETYFMFYPLVLFYFSDKKISVLIWLIISSSLYIAFRYWVDVNFPYTGNQSPFFDHISNVPHFLSEVISLHTVGDVFMVFGVFWVIIIGSFLFYREEIIYIWKSLGVLYWMIPIAIIHVILSGWYVGRMFFLVVPVISVLFGRIVEFIYRRYLPRFNNPDSRFL